MYTKELTGNSSSPPYGIIRFVSNYRNSPKAKKRESSTHPRHPSARKLQELELYYSRNARRADFSPLNRPLFTHRRQRTNSSLVYVSRQEPHRRRHMLMRLLSFFIWMRGPNEPARIPCGSQRNALLLFLSPRRLRVCVQSGNRLERLIFLGKRRVALPPEEERRACCCMPLQWRTIACCPRAENKPNFSALSFGSNYTALWIRKLGEICVAASSIFIVPLEWGLIKFCNGLAFEVPSILVRSKVIT